MSTSNGIEYYDMNARNYATAGWVHEVSEKCALIMHQFRPFTDTDIVVDYGYVFNTCYNKLTYILDKITDKQSNKNCVCFVIGIYISCGPGVTLQKIFHFFKLYIEWKK